MCSGDSLAARATRERVTLAMALVGHTASVGRVAGLPRRSRECHRRCSRVCLQATGDDEIERSRDELERLVSEENAETLSGSELRNLIVSQFGKPFDTRLRQQRDAFNDLNMYLQARPYRLAIGIIIPSKRAADCVRGFIE